MGKYNCADTTSALIIGNGTSAGALSDALKVDFSGNLFAAGTINASSSATSTFSGPVCATAFSGGGLSSGSVLFSDGTDITQNNSNLYWSGSDLEVGPRGTNPLDASLEAYASSGAAAHFHWTGAQGVAGGAVVNLSSSQASAMNSGSRLGSLQFAGSYDATENPGVGSSIVGCATQNWTSTSTGGNLVFNTVPNNTTTRTAALTLNQDQTATFTGAITDNSAATSSFNGNICSAGNVVAQNFFGNGAGLTGITETDPIFTAWKGCTSLAAAGGASAGGSFSAAIGASSTANGAGSVALGYLSCTCCNASAALGECATARGVCSVALGYKAVATSTGEINISNGTTQLDINNNVANFQANAGAFAGGCICTGAYMAVGGGAVASSTATIAMGCHALACCAGAIAMGCCAVASGYDSSIALGNCSIANGTDVLALGGDSVSCGSSSAALGWDAQAYGGGSLAMGLGAIACGSDSTAIGNDAIACGCESAAIGYDVTASGNYQTVLGKFNATDTTSALIIGNGPGPTMLGDAMKVDFSGNITAGGATLSGPITENSVSTSTFACNICSAGNIVAAHFFGDGSHLTGISASETLFTAWCGCAKLAAGSGATAGGPNAIALGYNVSASGNCSVALGYTASASGGYSTAIGPHAYTVANCATALGYAACAAGDRSPPRWATVPMLWVPVPPR